MHVLHWFKDFYPPTVGGVENHISQVVTNMEGVRFTVLTSSRSRRTIRETLDGVEVIRAAEFLRPASTPIMPAWRSLMRSVRADVIHAHMPNPWAEICALTTPTPPIVASYHADIVGRRRLASAFEPLRQQFFKKASTIVVGSARLADTAPALAGHRRKIEVVPYGIDPASWETTPELTDEIRRRYPGPVVLFLGRHRHYKGLEVLVRAMSEIDATCLIVGDGPYRRATEDLVRLLRLEDKVALPGEVAPAERSAYFHAADVFVLPSTNRAESYGISMLEAMACGRPVISTEVGTATSWINLHGITGLVVAPGDVEELAKAIRELLADATLRSEMGAAALQRARDEFGQERMLTALRQIYEAAAS